jgi:hypothetical protein
MQAADHSFEYLTNMLALRERTLRVVREEVDLLNACGGMRPEDVHRLRNVIIGQQQQQPYIDPNTPVPAIVIKDEPARHANQPTTSLKAMLQGMLPNLVPDSQMTQLCKRVKSRISTVYTFQKKKATYLLTRDWAPVREALEAELAENGWRYGRDGGGMEDDEVVSVSD